MKTEDLKIGTKLKVVKPYRHNGIAFKEGEIIEIRMNLFFGGAFSVKSKRYSNDVIVPSEFLLNCCRVIPSKVETKSTNKPYTNQLLYANSIQSKPTVNVPKYRNEISTTFDGKKYVVGDFIRAKLVNGNDYYGKIKEINTTTIQFTTIQLTKLSSNEKYSIELEGIAEMENIG